MNSKADIIIYTLQPQLKKMNLISENLGNSFSSSSIV